MQLNSKQIIKIINELSYKNMTENQKIDYLFDLEISIKKSLFRTKNALHRAKLKAQLTFVNKEFNNLLPF